MSIFHCAICHDLKDSDDGCEEYDSRPYTKLICAECADAAEQERHAEFAGLLVEEADRQP